MDAVEILTKAKKILEDNEWGQWRNKRELKWGKVAYCGHGAVVEAVAGISWTPNIMLANNFLQAAVKEKYPQFPYLVYYNDYVAKTKEEVLDVFSRAIAIARETSE